MMLVVVCDLWPPADVATVAVEVDGVLFELVEDARHERVAAESSGMVVL